MIVYTSHSPSLRISLSITLDILELYTPMLFIMQLARVFTWVGLYLCINPILLKALMTDTVIFSPMRSELGRISIPGCIIISLSKWSDYIFFSNTPFILE